LDKSRKHGVFSMGNARQVNPKTSNNHWIPIDYALELVYKQMNIAGNRSRTIKGDVMLHSAKKLLSIDVKKSF